MINNNNNINTHTYSYIHRYRGPLLAGKRLKKGQNGRINELLLIHNTPRDQFPKVSI